MNPRFTTSSLVAIPPATRHRFTPEAEVTLLQAIKDHPQWTTAREAYGWAWSQRGLRVAYLTVLRFLDSEGLLVGDTLRSRRLRSTAVQPVPVPAR
jgi:hypothetical protein